MSFYSPSTCPSVNKSECKKRRFLTFAFSFFVFYGTIFLSTGIFLSNITAASAAA